MYVVTAHYVSYDYTNITTLGIFDSAVLLISDYFINLLKDAELHEEFTTDTFDEFKDFIEYYKENPKEYKPQHDYYYCINNIIPNKFYNDSYNNRKDLVKHIDFIKSRYFEEIVIEYQ